VCSVCWAGFVCGLLALERRCVLVASVTLEADFPRSVLAKRGGQRSRSAQSWLLLAPPSPLLWLEGCRWVFSCCCDCTILTVFVGRSGCAPDGSIHGNGLSLVLMPDWRVAAQVQVRRGSVSSCLPLCVTAALPRHINIPDQLPTLTNTAPLPSAATVDGARN